MPARKRSLDGQGTWPHRPLRGLRSLMSQGAAAGPDWKAHIELMLRNFEFHSAISLRSGRAAPDIALRHSLDVPIGEGALPREAGARRRPGRDDWGRSCWAGTADSGLTGNDQ